MAYSNSPLVNYVKKSPNHSGTRNHKIDTITIHSMAGNMTVESCGEWFSKPKNSSSNYGIDSAGKIALYVDEKNRSHCSSSAPNDHRAVTIEVANDGGKETGWHISDAAYESLIRLVTDICRRNNIKQLKWKADKSLVGNIDQQNVTVHMWFADKDCPGPYIYNKLPEIIQRVNAQLNHKEDDDMTQEEFNKMFISAMTAYRKTLQDNDSGNWSKDAREWAISSGLIQGGLDDNGQPNYMWEDFLNREQLIQLLYRFRHLI